MGGCESVGGIPEDTSLTFSVFGPNDTLRHKCHARIPRPESDRLRHRGHASCQPRKSPSSAPRVIFASSPLDVHFSLFARSLLRLIEGRKDIESPHMGHFCLAPSGSLLLVTPSHQTHLRSFVHRIPFSDKFRARRPPITAVCTRNSEETQSLRPPQEPMEEGKPNIRKVRPTPSSSAIRSFPHFPWPFRHSADTTS